MFIKMCDLDHKQRLVKYSSLSENLFLLLEKQFREQGAHIKAPNLLKGSNHTIFL